MIEAAPEDLELKRELFADLADACGPETILATNTSSLPVTEIAAGVAPPASAVVGMHFFNPPALMKLVEVVATADSSAAALEATTEVGERMGRTPIRAKDSPGFIANRLARPFSLESLRMLADGVADAATIDRVCRLGGGFRMGPFELIDLIGLDVNLSVARSFYAQGGEPERWRPSPIQERLVGEGQLGRKSGARLLRLRRRARIASRDPGARASEAPTLDPDELAEIDPAAPEILPRLFAQIANEAAFALEEGVGSPADMDTAMRLGFNWPLGPLELTELIGAERAVAGAGRAARARTATPTGPRPRLVAAARRSAARFARPMSDFEEARRGLVAAFDPPRVEDERGRTVWDLESYDFLDGEPPETAHPEPLAAEPAEPDRRPLRAGAGLLPAARLRPLEHARGRGRGGDRRDRPAGLRRDRGGGARPLPRAPRRAPGHRPDLHPQPRRPLRRRQGRRLRRGGRGAAASRSSPPPASSTTRSARTSSPARRWARRAGYMYGALLERGPDGQLGSGLGQTTSLGTITLIPPNLDIAETGQEEIVDGVRMSFQLTPGTEAPAEMNIHFPDARVLCIADNAARSMHNILTPRGALVRDPRVWAHYLDEAIELFGADSDVLFAGHHWPCWGSERIVDFLEKQRDLYAYLHDQTLRLLNQGHTGPEIAELIELPPSLADEWHCREYYGSVSHNVKAIYQRYMGWFDGNPAHLWEHPPVEQARRYVEFMGGAEAVLEKARASPSTPATTAGSPRSSTTSSSPSPRTRRRASCRPTRSSSSATAPRTRPGATSS